VLRQSPSLPRALCRDAPPHLFDATTEADTARAVAICSWCPELQRCKAWAATLPANTLHGVVAGQRHRTRGHPKATT
jgi:hypothetical protein